MCLRRRADRPGRQAHTRQLHEPGHSRREDLQLRVRLVGLCIVVMGFTASCMASGSSQSTTTIYSRGYLGPNVEVRIRFDVCSAAMAGQCHPAAISYAVRCGGRTHSLALEESRFCNAIAFYIADPARAHCAPSDRAMLTAAGTYRGHPFRLTFATANSWCGASPRQRAALVAIGTYPCRSLPRTVPSPLCLKPRGDHAVGPLELVSIRV